MLGFGGEAVAAVDAPSGHRLDLLAAGRAAARRARGFPRGATSARACATRCSSAAACRSTRSRRPGRRSRSGRRGSGSGFELFDALAPLGLYRPDADGSSRARSARGRCATAASARPTPTPSSARLLGHRPPPKRTPWGLQQRIAALKLRGIVDDDGGLWQRTVDELDACAAAYAAYALAEGFGSWVGEPEEGVIVLPIEELEPAYEPLPPPRRAPLA